MNEVRCALMVGGPESKVVFEEGNEIRVLRGRIVGEDNSFLCLQRRDAMYRISKSIILKISQPREESR